MPSICLFLRASIAASFVSKTAGSWVGLIVSMIVV
jgi:hypothetical protein